MLHGLKWGQISIFLVVLTIAGLSKGGRFGGALIGIAAAIKGYPFVYLLHPLLRQKQHRFGCSRRIRHLGPPIATWFIGI